MNGVSAVRAYTLIAMLAIVAGGWMLNEAPEVDLMEEEMEYIEQTRIKTLIKKYCDFIPIEISLEGAKEEMNFLSKISQANDCNFFPKTIA